jgi:DNA-binding transcriptional MerR regulator
MKKLINISQLSKLLNLVNSKTNKPSNYILRYWEKEFKQINPILLQKRRYYSEKQVNIIKLINFLLKTKGMTIKGVQKILNFNINSLDDYNSYSLKADYYKDNIKIKSKEILKKLKELKKHGKKNSFKS